MKRKEFISKLPIGAAFAFSLICGGGCRQKEKLEKAVHENTMLRTDTLPDPNKPMVDFTINMETAEYETLKSLGGYAFYENTIIVFTEEGEYIAATKICSDEYLPRLIWKDGEYLCLAHGATFDQDGNGTLTHNNLGKNGIEVYNTELMGNTLRVYS